jgi:hypothetical protein
MAKQPQLRVQDGLKIKLLCRACEQMFSQWETAFANKIFYPYVSGATAKVSYGDWLLKFCVSVSWRTLKYIESQTSLHHWSDLQKEAAHNALEQWRAFLFGEVDHPGVYEQHLLPLDGIGKISDRDVPNFINRYLMRAVEIDAPHGERSAFIYTKMGRFALFGIIQPTALKWRGSRVGVKSGVMSPGNYTLPIGLFGYFKERARKHEEFSAAIPDHQADKIEAEIMKNPDRLLASDQWKAMLNDHEMFGPRAVIRKP